jgi:hypothetical protein
MKFVLGARSLLAAGAWLSYTYRNNRVWLRRILGLIALAGLCFIFFYPSCVYTEGMEYEMRHCRAANVGMDLFRRTNSTMLDGTSREFTADLASILGGSRPWPYVDLLRRGDRRAVSVS